jgi:hypothetical protein
VSHLGDRLHPWLRSPSPLHVAETACSEPLDPARQSYYLSREPRMNVSSYFRGTLVVSPRHRWICLFLAFFLLYNPFLAAPRKAGGLEVCRPASHRATVGASELQHFTTASSQELTGFVDFAPTERPFLLRALPGLISFHVSHALFPPKRLLCASLWFRPPPAS